MSLSCLYLASKIQLGSAQSDVGYQNGTAAGDCVFCSLKHVVWNYNVQCTIGGMGFLWSSYVIKACHMIFTVLCVEGKVKKTGSYSYVFQGG